jgi:hypothetical protein
MATKTIMRIPYSGTNIRNALVEIQRVLEGTMTVDEPFGIEQVQSAGTVVAFQITFADTAPDEQIRAALTGLANLIERPESGLGRGMTFTNSYDPTTEARQREYSR